MINWDKHTQHRFGKDGGTSKHNSKMQILTAGLARLFVRGKSRVPAPPPKMMETTFLGSALWFCIAGAYIMSPNLSATSFMKTIFSPNKLAWKLQTHDIQSILNPQRGNHRTRFQMLSLKAQIIVAEETLAIEQDATVSHLQIQSNLQKTHQDCCIHDPFRKDTFCHNSRSWALEKDIKDKPDRRATTQRYIYSRTYIKTLNWVLYWDFH
jgi:hypothetical protein